jgi:hypothetical protein
VTSQLQSWYIIKRSENFRDKRIRTSPSAGETCAYLGIKMQEAQFSDAAFCSRGGGQTRTYVSSSGCLMRFFSENSVRRAHNHKSKIHSKETPSGPSSWVPIQAKKPG